MLRIKQVASTVIPWYLWGIGSRTSVGTGMPYVNGFSLCIEPTDILLYILNYL